MQNLLDDKIPGKISNWSSKWLMHQVVYSNLTQRVKLTGFEKNNEPGYMPLFIKTFSDDDLVMTYTAFWKDRASFDEYDSDPILIPCWTARDAYCAENNIILGPQTFEEMPT